jgi:formate dehydrogenase accessory protein FdhE
LRAEVDSYASQGVARLHEWWRRSRSGRTDYLARAVLRPYAETLVAGGVAPEPFAGPAPAVAGCPCCGGPAWIAWRRSGSGDEAAQRFLGCGVCGSERELGRIACAACGETAPEKLAVFQTERHPAVRIEACDACQRYVKSIDLTVDGLAVPEIDDLCSLSMDLWATDQGYERLEPSLAGV